MSCTQYTPLLGRLVQSVAKTSLMCLHESALSDLIFPNDGSILVSTIHGWPHLTPHLLVRSPFTTLTDPYYVGCDMIKLAQSFTGSITCCRWWTCSLPLCSSVHTLMMLITTKYFAVYLNNRLFSGIKHEVRRAIYIMWYVQTHKKLYTSISLLYPLNFLRA